MPNEELDDSVDNLFASTKKKTDVVAKFSNAAERTRPQKST